MKRELLFSILVTLSMNALDVVYHLLTSTAVHLHYVAVKFTVIFLVTFLISYLAGISLQEGIACTIIGPTIFYIYYRAATPTLDRSIFVLDENFGYIFVHAAAFFLVYWLALAYVIGERPKPTERMKKVAAVLATALGLFYLLVPYSTIKTFGLHLELAPGSAAILGAILFLCGGTAVLRKSFASKTSYAQGFLAGGVVAVLEAGLHMGLRTQGLVNELQVFNSATYLLIMWLVTFLASATEFAPALSGFIALIAGGIAELIFIKQGLPSSVALIPVHAILIFVSRYVQRYV